MASGDRPRRSVRRSAAAAGAAEPQTISTRCTRRRCASSARSAPRCTTTRCCARLSAAGQAVDGTRVRWDPDFVMAQLALAPESFALTGRNPERRRPRSAAAAWSHSPVGGAAVRARPRARPARRHHRGPHRAREARPCARTLCPCCKAARPRRRTSTTTAGTSRWTTRSCAGATARSSSTAPAARRRVTVSRSRPSRRVVADALRERPMVIGIVNPNSPLVWDGLMVETLVACAEYGQPVAITPFLLAGASAPVTLAAGLVPAGRRDARRRRDGAAGPARNAVHPRLLLQRRRHAIRRTIARAAGVGPDHARRARRSRGATACRCAAAVACARASPSTPKQRPRARCRCGRPTSRAATSSCTPPAGSRAAWSRPTRSSRSTSKSSGCSSDSAKASPSTRSRSRSTPSPRSGPGGLFLAHEHTLARFRTDVFMSPLFRSQAYPTWVKLGSSDRRRDRHRRVAQAARLLRRPRHSRRSRRRAARLRRPSDDGDRVILSATSCAGH